MYTVAEIAGDTIVDKPVATVDTAVDKIVGSAVDTVIETPVDTAVDTYSR